MTNAITQERTPVLTPVTTYREQKIGNTLYRVTNVYIGEIDLGRAVEKLIVKKILALENTPACFSG